MKRMLHGLAILAVGGMVAGCAAGLKLTMLIYLPGLLLVAALLETGRRPWVCLSFLTLGMMFGFVACAGWWMLAMNDQFGNPLFPYFNEVFQSAWVVEHPYRDLRFLPASLWEGLFKPLVAAADYSSALELKFRGPRVVALFLSLLVLPALFMLYHRRGLPAIVPLPLSSVTIPVDVEPSPQSIVAVCVSRIPRSVNAASNLALVSANSL